MKRLVLAAALLVLLAVVVSTAACGGNEVPAGAIAAVGDGVVTQEQFEEIMTQAKAQYASTEGAPEFPEEGTPTYNQLVASIVNYLVQNELITQQAAEFDVNVTDEELTERLAQVTESVGGEKKLNQLLKQQSVTMEQLKEQLRASMLADEVKQKVMEDVEISDEKIKEYFENPDNAAQFQQAETRDTRHILTETKEQAAEARALLAADSSDENWKKVAKEYSTDPGSKESGGSLGAVSQGQMVAGFEKATWKLDVDDISQPVKTQFGWHVIQVTKITEATKQTLEEAKETIRQMLLYQEQSTAWTDWFEQAKKDADIVYADGFNPDKLTVAPSPEASPSATATE